VARAGSQNCTFTSGSSTGSEQHVYDKPWLIKVQVLDLSVHGLADEAVSTVAPHDVLAMQFFSLTRRGLSDSDARRSIQAADGNYFAGQSELDIRHLPRSLAQHAL
jgi:hypothetical protein